MNTSALVLTIATICGTIQYKRKKDGHGSQMDSVPSLSVSACGYTESGRYHGTESVWVEYEAMARMVEQKAW